MLKIKLLLVSLFALALTACGGGGSSTASVGTFADAGLVSGLQYQTATQSGVTDADGKFNYLLGETVTFKIGNIVLGQAIAGPALNTFSLVGIAPPLTSLGLMNKTPNGKLFQKAINISVFLQTLDADANPQNGIAIPTQAIDLAANTSINFNQQLYEFFSSFALRQYIGRSRVIGLWGGSRAIVLSGYATNQLYAGLKLNPTLFATSRSENFTPSGAIDESSTKIHDANGNLIESKYFNGRDVLHSRYTYTYDVNGNKIEEKYFNGSDVLEGRSTSTYDANGNLIESKYFDGSDVLQSRSTSTYDANGNLIESKYFDGSDVLEGRSTSTYDAKGNLIETKYFDGSDVLQSRYTSTYDANGNLIDYKNFNGSDVLDGRSTSTYDAKGNLIETKYFDGSDVLERRSTSTYDANGNLIESKYFDGRDVLQSRYTSTYDVNGNEIESKYFVGSDVLQWLHASTYDSNGNLIELKYFNGSDVLQSRTLNAVSPISGWANILTVSFFGPK